MLPADALNDRVEPAMLFTFIAPDTISHPRKREPLFAVAVRVIKEPAMPLMFMVLVELPELLLEEELLELIDPSAEL